MRIRLDIEYDGAPFAGWQRQPHRPTVQALIEEAVAAEAGGERIVVVGASRTDSGVHALGQVAHFTADTRIPADRWSRVLNRRLPAAVRVVRSAEAPAEFHAQKGVASKLYIYRILNRSQPSALDRRALHVPWPLDWTSISEAARHFVGRHDFRAFRASGSGARTTVREILRLDVVARGEGLYCFEVEGTGFLKQMVRSIAGTLLEVGEGKRRPAEIPAILAGAERGAAGRTAPPDGLFLAWVRYASDLPRKESGLTPGPCGVCASPPRVRG